MNKPIGANAAEAARPTVEVRDGEGALLPRISAGHADLLYARGWARWSGKGARRHLTLTDDAPLRRLPPGSHAGTKRDRADQTCRVYKDRQPFGGPHQVEFIPTT
ncbi:MAG: hypothetical protein LAQ30_33000 [Acidobacteriia bacterium]|nr:hypothetical protein [Terriglobia bacterium]